MTTTSEKRPTIHDVARHAGVAVGTVSRYLNGRPTRDGSARKIETSVAQLGFVRNLAAATIRNETSSLIGFLVSSYDEFQIEVLARLTERMQAKGRLLLPLTHDGSVDTMRRALRFFAEHRVGAIVASGDFPAMAQMADIVGSNTQFILFNNDLPGLTADRVHFNDETAMRKAVAHLVQLGHRRIGIITGRPGHSSAAGRLSGYRLALQDAGLPFDNALMAGQEWTERAGYLGAKQLFDLPEPPTALVCSSYLNAIGVADYANDRGIAIPNDLSLISFGDAHALRLISKGIDAVSFPIGRMVEMIESCYQNVDDRRERINVQLECDFFRRGSTAAPEHAL